MAIVHDITSSGNIKTRMEKSKQILRKIMSELKRYILYPCSI